MGFSWLMASLNGDWVMRPSSQVRVEAPAVRVPDHRLLVRGSDRLPEQVGGHYDSVWDALEDTPAEAENLKIRSALMQELTAQITKAGMTQSAAARQFGVTQPRISDLMRGKIDLFSIDTLVNMLGAAGLQVDLRVRRAT